MISHVCEELMCVGVFGIIIIIIILLKQGYKIQFANNKMQMAWLKNCLVVGCVISHVCEELMCVGVLGVVCEELMCVGVLGVVCDIPFV